MFKIRIQRLQRVHILRIQQVMMILRAAIQQVMMMMMMMMMIQTVIVTIARATVKVVMKEMYLKSSHLCLMEKGVVKAGHNKIKQSREMCIF